MAPCVWFRGERHVVGLARSGTLAAALLELLMVQPLSTTHERTKPPCAVPSRPTADTADGVAESVRHHATLAQQNWDRVWKESPAMSIFYCIHIHTYTYIYIHIHTYIHTYILYAVLACSSSVECFTWYL